MNTPRLTWMSLAILSVALTGCGRGVSSASNPIAVEAAEYDRVYDASVEVLRDLRFTVDRKDKRFGIVTTRPLIASSAFEPWYADNTTARQVAESTLNMQRRTVRIEIIPTGASGAPGQPAAPQSPVQEEGVAPKDDRAAKPAAAKPAPPPLPREVAAANADGYQMKVTVLVDRRYHPPTELNNTALGSAEMRGASNRNPDVLTEAGRQTSYWQTIGRDEQLEKRLVEMVLNRALAVAKSAAPADAAAPASTAPAPAAAPAAPADKPVP